MSVVYLPRAAKSDAMRARQDERARALGLIVAPDGTFDASARVAVGYLKWTADYREMRARPFIVYTQCGAAWKYRTAFATLDAAASAALALDAAMPA